MPQHLAPHLAALRAELAGHAVMLAAIRLQLLLRKANFNPAQLRDAIGRWTENGGGGGLVHEVSRRPRGAAGTPAQEAQFAAAWVRALAARRRLRELDPTWRPPQSAHPPGSIEGQIRHQEGVARAAEARFAEIVRDAIPNTNPSWGVNRLRSELNDQGYIFAQPARDPGFIFVNPRTGDEVRIMQRPPREPFRTESRQKFHNQYYYRYKPAGGGWGSHITIPDR